MRWKVTNIMPPTTKGEDVKLDIVFESFEKVVDKIVRDLNSIWKGTVPPDQTFNIKSVPNDTPLGMNFYVDGKKLAYNPEEVEEAFDTMGVETLNYFQAIYGGNKDD